MIQLSGALHLRDGFHVATFRGQLKCVPMMRGRVVWIELDRLGVLFLGRGPIPIVCAVYVGQRVMSFGQ